MKKINIFMLMLLLFPYNVIALLDTRPQSYIFFDNATIDFHGNTINNGDFICNHGWYDLDTGGTNNGCDYMKYDTENGKRFINISANNSNDDLVFVYTNNGGAVGNNSFNTTWTINFLYQRVHSTSAHRNTWTFGNNAELIYESIIRTDFDGICTQNIPIEAFSVFNVTLIINMTYYPSELWIQETINQTSASCDLGVVFGDASLDMGTFKFGGFAATTPFSSPATYFKIYYLKIFNGTNYPQLLVEEAQESITTTSSNNLGIYDTMSEAGNGIGVLLTAIRLPLGGFMLYFAIIAGVIGMIGAILYIIGKYLGLIG